MPKIHIRRVKADISVAQKKQSYRLMNISSFLIVFLFFLGWLVPVYVADFRRMNSMEAMLALESTEKSRLGNI